MKKVLILLITFYMLLSSNVFAGANTDNFTPKNEISDVRKSKKINTIQKLLNTKIGKWVVKNAINKQITKPQYHQFFKIPMMIILIFILISRNCANYLGKCIT